MQQLFRLLIFLIQPHTFRVTNSPILRSSFLPICSFWYNAPTLLPTGATVEMERSPISNVASVGSSIGAFYQKLYIQSKRAPEDGRICRLKHVGLI